MDRRFLTVLGVSLVFALVVSSVFYQMTARSTTTKQTQTDMKDVVVATRPLGIGVTVKPADVKVLKITAEAFPKGAFSKVEEVIDRPIVSNILIDEPVLEGRLAARGSGLGLAPVIPVGMRAVSVRVNDVAGVAGFVQAGMRVDVLVTGRPPNGESNVVTTCLQNILVLSSGAQIQADARGQAMPAPTVTLLASPEQAELLTLANTEGHIQLVLRNGSDQAIEKTSGRNTFDLYGARARPQKPVAAAEDRPRPRPRPAPAPVAAVPVAAPVPVAPPDQVIMIRGNQKTVEIIPSRAN
ncbi:MAG: Flp pilus assembly protein CpaB [Bryobacteraceae bacterium]